MRQHCDDGVSPSPQRNVTSNDGKYYNLRPVYVYSFIERIYTHISFIKCTPSYYMQLHKYARRWRWHRRWGTGMMCRAARHTCVFMRAYDAVSMSHEIMARCLLLATSVTGIHVHVYRLRVCALRTAANHDKWQRYQALECGNSRNAHAVVWVQSVSRALFIDTREHHICLRTTRDKRRLRISVHMRCWPQLERHRQKETSAKKRWRSVHDVDRATTFHSHRVDCFIYFSFRVYFSLSLVFFRLLHSILIGIQCQTCADDYFIDQLNFHVHFFFCV